MKYPLEAARTLRAVELERAERDLGEAIAGLEAKRKHRILLDAALHAFDRETADRSVVEGATTGAALQRLEAYGQGRRERRKALETERAESAKALERAEIEVERARQRLAEAHAAHGAVERHHDRFEEAEKRAAEEAEADERDGSRGR